MARRPIGARRGEAEPTVSLGQAVSGFLKESGISAVMKHPEIHEAWQRTVGPDIAAHSRVLGFRRGVLEIAVDSSALMSEIQFHRAALLQDLRREIRKPFISALSFVVKAKQEPDDSR